ncbi:hypothetical protein SSX86_025238 [Deinandra increscens subsp. villosa]|uniref:Epidermal patterning factor-like protein n=1 Tax=Deinandra increscens subsp. villosa TaxID=3103831 RepID=A0AAP0CCP8_9ASTR
MGCGHKYHKLLHHLSISILFILIPITTQLRSFPQGKWVSLTFSQNHIKIPSFSPQESCFLTLLYSLLVIYGRQIGSRPPRCERRCGSCDHCEAIQVPTSPQIKTAINEVKNPKVGATDAYVRGDYSSNYKPLSWKCKCGSFIFNP